METLSDKGRISHRHRIGLIAGIALFLLVLLLPLPGDMSYPAHRTAAVAVLMAVWWMTEAVSIAITALIPLVLFPLLGIMTARDTAASFGDSNIYLFFGGFLIAAAMEKSGLHLRIAYTIITIVGKSPRSIVLGFMTATAFLSLWISNTATALLMLPIGIATICAVEELPDIDAETHRSFGTVLMLGIAYSASVGGIGTLIGTPPNIIFASSAAALYPDLPRVGFLTWLAFALPITCLLLPCIWLILTRGVFNISGKALKNAREILLQKKADLGPMRPDEAKLLIIFSLTALGWIFRVDISIGAFTIPGWADMFPKPEYINDATVAIAAAIVLFLTPVDKRWNDYLLTWKEAREIPWGILILFGGGIALASGFSESGLSSWLGNLLHGMKGMPVWLVIFLIAMLVTFLTEITSNTATATLFMPLMGGLAEGIGYHPYLFMIPAAVSASCAFMLPVATPPNAIILSSGRVNTPQMAKTGIWINIIGAIIITAIVYFIVPPLFSIHF